MTWQCKEPGYQQPWYYVLLPSAAIGAEGYSHHSICPSVCIPMRIDPAPQMTNLYLYYYEAKFMEMLTKENYNAANKF